MKKYFKKLLLIIVLFLLLVSTTGCWDNMDINDRAFASAVGLDKGENGDVEVSVQILRPNIINAIREGGSDEKAIWVATKTGETVFDAIREQLKSINRRPFYSHLQSIVISEELAREGIGDIIDFFFRDHEVAITPDVLIAKGIKAKDVINLESELETIPSLHIAGILENNVAEAKTRNVDLISVITDLTAPHGSGVIGTIEAIDKEKMDAIKDMKIEGAAVLKKDKLIGYLDGMETRGYLFIKDEIEGGILNINHPTQEDKKIAIEIHRSKSQAKPRIENEELVFGITVELDGSVGEVQGPGGWIEQELLQEIEDAAIKEIEDSIKKTIKLAQEQYETDFLGFGNEVHRNYPQYWKEIKGNWDQEFTQLSININAKVSIQRTGIISQPILFE